MKWSLAGLVLAVGAAAFVSGCSRAASEAAPSSQKAGHDAGHAAAHSIKAAEGGGGAAAARASSAELAFLFPDGDDRGWAGLANGGQHSAAPHAPLASVPAPVRAQLIRQLALTAGLIQRYPTVKEAEAAGYRRVGPFFPGMGTHYIGGVINKSGTLTDDEILRPSSILYDGMAPDSPIAGFMYMHEPPSEGAGEPEGFAGPNDHWHRHTNVCLAPGQGGAVEALGGDGSITEADCKAKGGNFLALSPYALHVWTVPAYTSALGVFSHLNPAITCPDGSYHLGRRDITTVCRQ